MEAICCYQLTTLPWPQILHYERDHEVLQRAAAQGGSVEGVEGSYYQTLAGLNPDMSTIKQHPDAPALLSRTGSSAAVREAQGGCCISPYHQLSVQDVQVSA